MDRTVANVCLIGAALDAVFLIVRHVDEGPAVGRHRFIVGDEVSNRVLTLPYTIVRNADWTELEGLISMGAKALLHGAPEVSISCSGAFTIRGH
jgi:hypothetical protein